MPDPLFPLTDLAELKQTGNLNNDWDLTALTLHLLFALVKTSAGSLSADDSPAPKRRFAAATCRISPIS